MSSFARNLFLAATFSLTGIISTFYIFKYYDDLANSQIKILTEPIARLDTTKNEVQRRAAKKVIWQRVSEDENLYSGESIRTLPDSEAKIIFASGAEVDLDPESVVEISDNNGKVNLDFVKGNLYVKGSDNTDKNLVLHSGNTSIDFKNADLSVTKTGNSLDAQVLRGSAEVNNGGKKMILDKDRVGRIGEHAMEFTDKYFKVKSPGPNDKAFIRVDRGEFVRFMWVPTEADYGVKLMTGSRRANLTSATDFVSGSLGEMNFKLKPGQIFWQLVAVNKKDPIKIYSSLINRLTIIAELAPKLLSPAKEAVIVLRESEQSFDVRWVNPSKLDRLHLEVSRQPQFASTVFSEEVEDTGVHSIAPTEEGDYFWRLSGFRPGSAVSLTSEARKFTLHTKLQLIPPILKIPLEAAHIPFDEVAGGDAFLSWSPVLGISKYKVTLNPVSDKKRPVMIREISDSTQMKIPISDPGNYQWSLVSIDQEGKTSNVSEVRDLTIEALPKLLWADSDDGKTYLYTTSKPTLALSWKPFMAKDSKIQSYRVTVKAEGKPDKIIVSNQTSKTIEIQADGTYQVLIESIAASGAVVAQTEPKNYMVRMRPLLPPPQFSRRMPGNIVAQKSGSFGVIWDTIPGAKRYLIEVKGPGGFIKKEYSNQTNVAFKGYLPGTYSLRVSAIDDYGRVGEFSGSKNLSVLNQSDVKRSSFKRINVN